MNAYDRWLSGPYTEQPEPPAPTEEHRQDALDKVCEFGSTLLLTDLQDEGFYFDNLRSVILAKTPEAQAKACSQFRRMFELVHELRINEMAQKLAIEEQKEREDYAAECVEGWE